MSTIISLQHILANYRHLQNQVHGVLTAVIKADAYGHGALKVYETLKDDCDLFAVANVVEGVQLRQMGANKRIKVLSDIVRQDEWLKAVEYDLEPVVHAASQIAYFHLEPRPKRIWLKFDSGMHRAGLARDEVKSAFTLAQENGIEVVALMSHLASAEDEKSDSITESQRINSEALAKELNIPLSLANSAACWRFGQKWKHDFFRAGISLYGMSPFAEKVGAELGLKAAMRVESEVIALKEISEGMGVGYNHIWHANGSKRIIGLIPFGYADGYPRQLSGSDAEIKAWVFIKRSGVKAPVIGRVSMDMITIDVTDLDVKENDSVELWGEFIPLEELAGKANTISYEVLTHAKLANRRGIKYG